MLPDLATELAPAPELAWLSAKPIARASPVSPELPEFPDVASPPMAMAAPRMPVLMAVGLEVALPVFPVGPELPETATGDEVALEVAEPVLPELVALDCDDAAPELPEVAVGLTFTVTSPPLPPLLSAMATLEPPTATAAEEVGCARRRRRQLR